MNIFTSDIWLRVPFYIVFGLTTEVLYTATSDLINPRFMQSWNVWQRNPSEMETKKRNVRAVGYTFLWMIPVYVLLVVVEPLSQWMKEWPLLLRGLVYLPVFWFVEYTAGAFIKKIVGVCPWDYSYSKWSLHGFIRWDMGPLWYLFSLIVDRLSAKLILLTPALKNVFFQ